MDAQKWLDEIELAENAQSKWMERGKKIIKRYRDERESSEAGHKFNIMWSNIKTMLPAVYARMPKPEVSRRYDDADPVARTASMMIERCLEYEMEQYTDFDSSVRCAIEDRLLPGRGVAWVRYEPYFETEQVSEDEDGAEEPQEQEVLSSECTKIDYVFWEDFVHQPARTWEEVSWVGRWVYMDKEELQKRFFEPINGVIPAEEHKYTLDQIPLSHKPNGLSDEKVKQQSGQDFMKAKICEIWDKRTNTAVWVCKDMAMLLDKRDDPLMLEGFFPCPKPLFATTTTDTLVPVPDFAQYQDQADELDTITERISILTKAVKATGWYAGDSKEVKRSIEEASDNALIPVDSWAMFADRGGVKGLIEWFPIDMAVAALRELYAARDQVKQIIYEVTGMADIIRGASVASETATAQQIKSQYASLRLKDVQRDVTQFCNSLIKMKAEIICNHYQPETILKMSGVEYTKDADKAIPALQLIKGPDSLRQFRIEVNADSMVQLDEMQEKQDRVEFLTAASNYLKEAVPAGQAFPQLAPILGELLMFGVRGFKAGREMEAAFEASVAQFSKPQAPKQDPEQMKALQAQQQQLQAMAKQLEDEKKRLSETQAKNEVANISKQSKIELDRMALDKDKEIYALQKQIEGFLKDQEKQALAYHRETTDGALSEMAVTVDSRIGELANSFGQELMAQAEAISDAAEKIESIIETVQKPKSKRSMLKRGKDGRAELIEDEDGTQWRVLRGPDGRAIGKEMIEE